MRKLVCGFDGSEGALNAARMAAKIAKQFDAQLTIVYVVEPPNPPLDTAATLGDQVEPQRKAARKLVVDAAEDLTDYSGVQVKGDVRIGRPAVELTNYAVETGAELIAVGTHGRGAAGRLLLGSVSDRIAHIARVPVLIVP